MKRRALGKGLDALLPDRGDGGNLAQIDLEKIRPNPLQPRVRFETERLEELAASIAENGVLQPIVVRRDADGGFELVAGERRWRAAQKAGLSRVPALIQEVGDQKMLELALVENIQRDELSPIEEANAYRLLVEEFRLTQETVAQRVGRSRTAVTNMLRLLKLPPAVQQLVQNGEISMGHARALLPLPRRLQNELAEEIRKRDLSVRQVEERVRRLLDPPRERSTGKRDANVRAAEERLEESLQTRVEIRSRGGKGRILVHFSSEEDLQRLYSRLVGES